MGTIASQITSLTSVYSTVYSDADQRKYQSSASLAFVLILHVDAFIPKTPQIQWNNRLYTAWPCCKPVYCRAHFQFCLGSYSNLCLLINKEEINHVIPRIMDFFCPNCQAQTILKGFIPMMKSGNRVWISKLVKDYFILCVTRL